MAIDYTIDSFFHEIEDGAKKARLIMNELLESHFYHEENNPSIVFMNEQVCRGNTLTVGSAMFNTLEWVQCYEKIMTKLLIINDYVVQTDNAMKNIMEIEKSEAEARDGAADQIS